jgi:hypothetical protein
MAIQCTNVCTALGRCVAPFGPAACLPEFYSTLLGHNDFVPKLKQGRAASKSIMEDVTRRRIEIRLPEDKIAHFSQMRNHREETPHNRWRDD